jgi:hypothetical protein
MVTIAASSFGAAGAGAEASLALETLRLFAEP